MPLIKLDAIDSTNNFLKQLFKDSIVEDYTIVIANEQTNGKGQMGASWVSEKGKNLTMSILIKNIQLENQNIYDFNIAVALAVIKVLKNIQIHNVVIKWPNDIMADSKKVAGILIENILKADGSFTAIVGIGLNLNQTNFEDLPLASSLKNITGKTYEQEAIALLLKDSLKVTAVTLNECSDLLWQEYHENLFKKDYPCPFEDKMGNRFMGIIKKVTRDGKLELILEDDSAIHFEVKEIKMLH
ncbi:biotin--[acetyl-CoA-carboxylase] ligase [Flavobacterium paronense]|uniref:Biotin--[acetyl-CoA-carboxylase] ligase n=1 Tax=Flavobacterium paronense TaxID=1392775 RepID=A0ABV5GAX5_9FLAO|nr:biotin--[acetyl-CoA-carboxylase] ligase [Flavobacterium paronense]MDN3676753.1 biotin--[acetyl-CoA-carboxylase] ligase [Flavobacterium paronense]